MLDFLGSAFSLLFLRKLFAPSANFGGVVPFSTLCSGSDVIAHVLNEFTHAFKERYDCNLQFKHMFSCESDTKRQSFINSTWDPLYIFGDITKMDGKRAYDIKSKRSVPCLVNSTSPDKRCFLFQCHIHIHINPINIHIHIHIHIAS